jgi:hypothetical protein
MPLERQERIVMGTDFSAGARRLGISSSVLVVILLAAYAITLAIGLASLESPDDPIRDPMFTILEILIISMMPAMVALMVAVHAWAPARAKAFSLASVVFMGLLAVLTMTLHFVILTVSRQTAFAELPWLPLLVSFKWPSVAYAVDILGWDVLFALSMFFAAPVFSGGRLTLWIRALMILSGALSLAGLSGVMAGDMSLRNIGIVGYVPVFLVVVVLLVVLFRSATPAPSGIRET